MSESADNPGVPIHPPLFFLSALLLGTLLNDRVHPLPVFKHDQWRWVGILGVLLGVAVAATGRKAMVSHGTNVNPTQPTTTIVTNGPFKVTRNPLYLSLTMLYIGLALLLNTWWSLFLLVPVWVVMHFTVVLREERYLQAKFGQSYLDYKKRVRRYL